MFKKLSTVEYFDIIKKNHREFLESNFVTHLDLEGIAEKKPIIDRFLSYLKNYHVLQKNYLENVIKGTTAAEKVGAAGISALIGLAIGGLFFAEQQKNPSLDLFGAKAVTQGGFAAVIGTSCSGLIYEIWASSAENPTAAELAAFDEQMIAAGFSKNKYEKLNAELVKLFHFRECLLLGLTDLQNVNIRTAFKDRYYPAGQDQEFNNKDFNLAIEVYFLDQLDAFFHQAFQDIYQLHQQELQEGTQEPRLIRWLKKHFKSEENQQRFTQQMQIDFMNQCIHFLEKERSEPSLLGEYIYLSDSIVGFLAAAIAISTLAIFIPFIPVAGLLGIGIVGAALGAIGAHLTVVNDEYLYYKRNKDNRVAILEVVQRVGKEQNRLAQLVQKVVKTTNRDLNALKQYYQQNSTGLLKALKIESDSLIASGSVRAWIREFAIRFQESEMIEDLAVHIDELVKGAYQQTETLQKLLSSLMSSTTMKAADLKILWQYIEDTKIYLRNKDHAEFIQAFESIQKIREQVLDSIGYVSSKPLTKGVPDLLVNFYTSPVSEGGLGGLISDIIQARRLSPIVADTVPADAHHPYQHLLTTAFDVNLKLNAAQNDLILQGDCQYRSMLGLPQNHFPHIEDQITVSNINAYLDASFDFLCSLNQYNANNEWRQPFQNHDQFILYRMVFVKQLANFADPNNTRVESIIKDAINTFLRTKLNCNPDIVLDDILHQAWLISAHHDVRTLTDQFGNSQSLAALASIADAIRVDITYLSNPLSPKDLITFESTQFLRNNVQQSLFACPISTQILPEFSEHFYNTIRETITTTSRFLQLIKTRPLLQQTNTVTIYTQEIAKDIDRIVRQMNRLLSLPNDLLLRVNREAMQSSIRALQTFKESLVITNATPIPSLPFTPDILQVEIITDAEINPPQQFGVFLSSAFLHRHAETPRIHIPPKQDQALKTAIAQLELYINAETSAAEKKQKPGGTSTQKSTGLMSGMFHKSHPHTSVEKTTAATRLKEALNRLQNNEPPEPYDWDKDSIYTANENLFKIVHALCPQGLNCFFIAEEQNIKVW